MIAAMELPYLSTCGIHAYVCIATVACWKKSQNMYVCIILNSPCLQWNTSTAQSGTLFLSISLDHSEVCTCVYTVCVNLLSLIGSFSFIHYSDEKLALLKMCSKMHC